MVAAGDQRAFEVLYQRHRDGLFRFCRSITGNAEDAEEAFQGAMLNAYRALREGARATPLRPWLFRIAHNTSVSLLRMRRVSDPVEDLDGVGDDRLAVHERVEQRERLRAMIDDFDRLPIRQRAALAMHEMQGLSHAAVARALDTTPVDARHLVHSARWALSEQDAGRGEACDRIRGLVIAGDRRVLRGRRIASHLRACAGCRGFAELQRDRSAAMALVFAPLPLAASERILDGILGRASTNSVSAPASGVANLPSLARVPRVVGVSLGAGATASVVGLTALLIGLSSTPSYLARPAHATPSVTVAPGDAGSPISSLSRSTRHRRSEVVALGSADRLYATHTPTPLVVPVGPPVVTARPRVWTTARIEPVEVVSSRLAAPEGTPVPAPPVTPPSVQPPSSAPVAGAPHAEAEVRVGPTVVTPTPSEPATLAPPLEQVSPDLVPPPPVAPPSYTPRNPEKGEKAPPPTTNASPRPREKTSPSIVPEAASRSLAADAVAAGLPDEAIAGAPLDAAPAPPAVVEELPVELIPEPAAPPAVVVEIPEVPVGSALPPPAAVVEDVALVLL